ncbi:MAG: four helix bundle protein [Sedimentisphaerales bacterium]
MSSNFENLDVWKKSCRLSVDLWQLLKNSNEYWLKEQMLRSALSIPSNIAEGCERNSKAEFKRFINIAKGSAAELRTQVYIAIETGVLKKESIEKFIEELKAITKMLQALINSLD